MNQHARFQPEPAVTPFVTGLGRSLNGISAACYSLFMSGSGELQDNTSVSGEEDAAPLCVRCLQPISGNPYYCPHCGHVANTLTPYLPYIEIPFYTRFIADSARLVKTPGASPLYRAFALLAILVLIVPLLPFLPVLLLLGLGFLVYRSWHKSSPE